MKNPFEVLMRKSAELAELEKQVQALRLVIPLLTEEGDRRPLEEKDQNKWP